MPFCYFAKKIGVDSPLAIITKKSIISYAPNRKIKITVIVQDSGYMETLYATTEQIMEQIRDLRLMESREIIRFRDKVRCNLEAAALKKAGEIASAMGLWLQKIMP